MNLDEEWDEKGNGRWDGCGWEGGYRGEKATIIQKLYFGNLYLLNKS